ncbi:unnamed protein product [Anisakis simplex]|uniref:HECT domain-containing protein n=1 Tax=Anisakis simplex TaxID=6269 RepID=A0A0M3KJF7_ANISI|nr:unnamed protein product [Anisakis simplex]
MCSGVPFHQVIIEENAFSTKEFLALLDEIVRLNITSDAAPNRKTLQYLSQANFEQHFRDYIGRVVGGGVDESGQFHLALPSNQMSGHHNIEPIERVLYEIKADNVTVEQLEDGVVSHFLQNTTAGERLRKHWQNVAEVRSRIDLIEWLYSVVKYFPLSEQCANKYIEHRTSDTKTFKVSYRSFCFVIAHLSVGM